MFHRWQKAGPGGFLLQIETLVAQPGGAHSVLFYAAEAFDDFVLRLQFRLPGPLDPFGKAIGNSGVFLRFRFPHTEWSDVNQQQPLARSNPAWVAAATGFEVQIDEQGKDFYDEKHRTSAIYDVPTGQVINNLGEPKDQHYAPGPVLEPNRWYEFEIEVVADTYTVRLGEVQEGQATAYQQVTTFAKPAGQYVGRGLSASAGQSRVIWDCKRTQATWHSGGSASASFEPRWRLRTRETSGTVSASAPLGGAIM